jgi:signal transduction histidine kinase
MSFAEFRRSPQSVMLAAALLAVLMSLASVLTAINRPHLDLPSGSTPTIVGDVALMSTDLMGEPDHLGTYPKMLDFFERQSMIAAELTRDQVTVSYVTRDGETETGTFQPRPRAITDLPFAFWFQQGVGLLGMLMAGWVMSLRWGDWGARMFALTGLFLAVLAMAAAVYSTRQIALPGDQFRILSSINHFGAAAFGIALVGLFMMYPRQIVRPVWLLVPVVIYSIGIMLELLYVGTDLWLNLIVSSQMLIAILLGVVQWWRTSGNQVDRAGLRWFLLFSLIGCSLFICLSVLPPVLGLAEQGYISQAYAFGFFNLMQLGLALGVVRWRVFDLDRYAYYIWLWLAGVFLIFATDLLLLFWLQDQPLTSLGIALVIVSFIYFPLRQFLLLRLLASKTPNPSEHIAEVFDVAIAPTKRLQDTRWDDLLRSVFATAGDNKILIDAPDQVAIADNGLALNIPAVAGMEGRQMQFADGGRRLFNTADMRAAAALCRMYAVAHDGHLAYERGVNMERDRISRDVHDNIGSQLLSALHTSEAANKDTLLRETLADLRQIISDGFMAEFDVWDVVADLRVEMADRLELRGIALEWPMQVSREKTDATPVKLPYMMANNLRSIMRELTSNVIKHSEATTVYVTITSTEDTLRFDVRDNGKTFDPCTVSRGAGLDSIAARIDQMGGKLTNDRSDTVMSTVFEVPLQNLSTPLSDEKAR